MARKVVVTETVTAELVTTPPPPPLPPSGARGPRGHSAEADLGVQVLGVAPGVALAEQMLALTTSLGLAAHNATAFQANHATILGASTVLAVATLLEPPKSRGRG